MADPISVEELLADQAAGPSNLLATLEAVPEKPDLVKITPWTPAGGCNCHDDLELPKAAISSVTPIGRTHYCCGKELKVVEVAFNEGETIDLANLIGQIMRRSQAGSPFEAGKGFDDLATLMARRGALPPETPFMPSAASRVPVGNPDGFWRNFLCDFEYNMCMRELAYRAPYYYPVASCLCDNVRRRCMGQPETQCQSPF